MVYNILAAVIERQLGVVVAAQQGSARLANTARLNKRSAATTRNLQGHVSGTEQQVHMSVLACEASRQQKTTLLGACVVAVTEVQHAEHPTHAD